MLFIGLNVWQSARMKYCDGVESFLIMTVSHNLLKLKFRYRADRTPLPVFVQNEINP